MYIKIQNNVLTDYADWNFEGSEFVNIDYNNFLINKDKYEIKNNKIIDISDTEEYKNKKRLQEIDSQLDEIDKLFYQESQKALEFEGSKYKFEWTTIYQNILNSDILPQKIWDISGLEEKAVLMDKEKLQSLQNYLLNVQEVAFQTRKSARSVLLIEKANIEKSLEGNNGI